MNTPTPGTPTPPAEPQGQKPLGSNKWLTTSLIVALALALVAVGYLLFRPQPQAPANENPTAGQNQTAKQDETVDWKTYRSETYGFELTVTDAWKGYKVFTTQGSQGVGAPDYIAFSMPTADQSSCVMQVTDEVCGYSAVLTVTVVQKDRAAGFSGNVIAEDNGVEYLYNTTADLPTDLKNVRFDIPQVVSSFKLLSPAATSGPKTYSSQQYGFTLQYPNDWTAHDFQQGVMGFSKTPPARDFYGNNVYPIVLEIKANAGGKTLAEWAGQNLQGKVISERGEVAVGSRTGLQFVENGMVNYIVTYVLSGGAVVRLAIPEDSESVSVYNQMLATFQFTN